MKDHPIQKLPFVLFCLAMLFTCALGQEDKFERKHQEQRANNPADISFTLQLQPGKKQFRKGEKIRFEMRFASRTPNTYQMSTASYDRRGRLDMEQFHLDPMEGVIDPMHGNLGIWGGGLFGIHRLVENPYSLQFTLNEWFRFDRPGRYRLYLETPRVHKTVNGRWNAEAVPLTSNMIVFEIIEADPAWQAEQLRSIQNVLNSKAAEETRREACYALRFLGSKAALKELVRRYDSGDEDCDFQYRAGLLGTPHPDMVVEIMEKRLVAPDQGISGLWLIILAHFSMRAQLRDPELTLLDHWGKHRDLSHQIKAKYVSQLAQSVSSKTGRAKAISINLLLEEKWDVSRLPRISTLFFDLPHFDQRALLTHRWKDISDPSMLPVLRTLYQKERSGARKASWDLGALALKRIYELSPSEGRRLILEEMKRSSPKVGMMLLTILPEETLPELDAVFAENLEKAPHTEFEIHSALIQRYATPAIYARVRAKLAGEIGYGDCHSRNLLLAYCLRANETDALELLHRLLEPTNENRSSCHETVLEGVATYYGSPALERLAIEALQNPNLRLAASAAAYLGKRGSAEAEQVLWQRYEKVHQDWRPSESDFRYSQLGNDELRAQQILEMELRNALSQSPNWLMDRRKLERIRQLCVSAAAKEKTEMEMAAWQGEIHINYNPNLEILGKATVAHYRLDSMDALKKKLAQFPRGTVFQWNRDGTEELLHELESYLNNLGCSLLVK